MKTLSDLKRDLKIGSRLVLTKAFANNHKYLGISRYIIKTQSNAVVLAEDKDAAKGSFLDLPPASLLEYDNKQITIYEPGYRELTAEEQKIKDNEPSRKRDNAIKGALSLQYVLLD